MHSSEHFDACEQQRIEIAINRSLVIVNEDQAAFLAGVVAGKITRSRRVAMMGGPPIFPIHMGGDRVWDGW